MKIYFLNSNTTEMEIHYSEKEYRDDIVVEIGNTFYEVYFFTKEALEYEMTKDGFFSLVGIIILEDISTKNIIKSIQELHKKGFFSSFKGEKDFNPHKRFMHNWYLNLGKETYENFSVIEIND